MNPVFWGVIPAAGFGARMESAQPKQFIQIAGKTILEHSVAALLRCAQIRGVVIALAESEVVPENMQQRYGDRLVRVNGGAERSDSVANALAYLLETFPGQNIEAVVHDAARPCLTQGELEALLAVDHGGQGAILAKACADTVKFCGASDTSAALPQIEKTLDRSQIRLAQTPQRFLAQALFSALVDAQKAKAVITDEASAMERMGCSPLLVPGLATNLKVTYPEDLIVAEAILQAAAETDGQRDL